MIQGSISSFINLIVDAKTSQRKREVKGVKHSTKHGRNNQDINFSNRNFSQIYLSRDFEILLLNDFEKLKNLNM